MSTEQDRLDALDRTLARLSAELAEAKRELLVARRATASAAAPYGAPALAALTIVMGAGALISWAVSRGLIGPWMRVSLGFLLAVVLAFIGYRVRVGGRRVFGNIMLAIALAVLHVVAWGAGPYLGLVPGWAALAVADIGAIALATLAIAAGDELPFAVAFGGALLAPFVMSTNRGAYLLLAGYGLILLAAALRVIRNFEWPASRRVAMVATAIYVLALRGNNVSPDWLSRELPASFALVVAAAVAVWLPVPARPRIAMTAIGIMAVFGAASPMNGVHDLMVLMTTAPDVPLMALAGAFAALVVARDLAVHTTLTAWAMSATIVPLLFLTQVLAVAGTPTGLAAAGLTAFWCVGYGAAANAERGRRKGVLLAMSAFVGFVAVIMACDEWPNVLSPALAAAAALYAWIGSRTRQPLVSIPCGVAVLLAFAHALYRMTDGAGFTSFPFATLASVGAVSAIGAGWLAVHWLPMDEPFNLFGRGWPRVQLERAVAIVLAFVWVRVELSRTVSADASTFLLLAYDAAAGVLALAAGRERREPALRHIGLGLALFAAVRAVVQAWNVQQIGLRVGSYLLVGAFLLLVARWYWERPKPTDGPSTAG